MSAWNEPTSLHVLSRISNCNGVESVWDMVLTVRCLEGNSAVVVKSPQP